MSTHVGGPRGASKFSASGYALGGTTGETGGGIAYLCAGAVKLGAVFAAVTGGYRFSSGEGRFCKSGRGNHCVGRAFLASKELMTMRLVISLGLLVLLLVVPVASQVLDDKLIVPGQRIGKWTLEMSMAELVQMNGRPQSERETVGDFATGLWVRDWPSLGLRVFTLGRDAQRIASLATFDEVYKTAKGVSFASSPEALEAAYGKPTAVAAAATPGSGYSQRWIYDEIGLFVVLGNIYGNTVGVFRPGTAKQLFRY